MSFTLPRGLCPALALAVLLSLPALLSLIVFVSSPAHASPIAYADGWMLMNENDSFENDLSLVYSPTATTGIGPFINHYRDTDGELAGLDFNWLAKRWNNRDSRANLYFLSGLGIANGGDHERPGGFAGVEADWESRRYYASYQNAYTAAGKDVRQMFSQKGRIGIAPYEGESGDWQTWLMLQADHFPQDRRPWTFTPLVRVFKDAYLAEAGVSSKGHVLFNFMITY